MVENLDAVYLKGYPLSASAHKYFVRMLSK
jgi:hypothetical protein